MRERRFHVDLTNPRVCVRAAYERHVERAGQGDVVCEPAPSCNESRILPAFHTRAENAATRSSRGHDDLLHSAGTCEARSATTPVATPPSWSDSSWATAWTALTMLW